MVKGGSQHQDGCPVVERAKGKQKERWNCSTLDSHVVPYHSTNNAAARLTSQIGRDAVLSRAYGRR
jgi:hypothetical protein